MRDVMMRGWVRDVMMRGVGEMMMMRRGVGERCNDEGGG